MTDKFIDSIDYLADTIDIAPSYEWRIMEINIAAVTKLVPRYCQPACPDYKGDSDKMCLKVDDTADKCTSWIFDQHRVYIGEKVFDVMFGTNSLDPHTAYAWRVGESYLRKLLGERRVDQMIKEFLDLSATPQK